MKPVQICYVISSFRPVTGGAELATERMAISLRRQGYAVCVVTRRQRPETPYYEEIGGVPVYRLGHPSRSKSGALTFALHCIFFFIFRLRTRLLHAQSLDTPVVVGMIAKLLTRRVLVLTIHDVISIRGRLLTRAGRLRLRLVKRLVDQYVVLNGVIETQLQEIGVPPSRIRLLRNGVNTDGFLPLDAAQKAQMRAQLGLNSTDRVVIFVGRLVPLKRVDMLFDAWARLTVDHSCRLLILGGGEQEAELKGFARELGIDVRFEGNTTNVVPYLSAADIFVLPSDYEGLSVALLEAMSSGLTVIASDCPGNAAVVTDEVDGLLSRVGDADHLTAQLRRVLDDDGLRQRLAHQARETVLNRYSIRDVEADLIDLYESLLK